ncbi:MAG: DNA polymerase III subunit alpha [Alphaproteobacteria bacterium]|nr:DNA polymerase III subunit alpha [Alphaproteobacteria bacterium]
MPAHADFVHLRVHTAFSLSEGAIKIKQLVKLCEKHAMPAVAITDTGNLFGALEFSQACADAGIQPIIGAQIALRREDGETRGGRKPDPDQLVLLCQDERGYGNLLKLVSKSFLATDPGEAPQISLADLERHADGLILLTGGLAGPVARLLRDNQPGKAEDALLRLSTAFPGRLYVELMRHGLPDEDRVEAALLDLAYAHGLPLIATNEAFFADPGMYEAHDALICVAEGAYVAQRDRRRLTPEHWFKSPAAMRALFEDLPEAIDNTLVVARRCAFMVKKRKPILPPFVMEGMSESDAMRVKTLEGLERRLERQVWSPGMDEAEREQAAKPYRERVDYELSIIAQMGFCGYFLIVADFIQWAKDNGVPVGPGRGSGAGSAVAWALTITDLDPLRFGLLFERFLNPERVSMPDFDIDFCQDRREEVIRYVQGRYGYDQVAQIITFGKLQARAVLRDVGRVLQMPYGQVDRICKLVPNNPADPVTLEKALETEPLLREQRERDEAVGHLIDLAMKLEGLYRHASTHAAGVVIGGQRLDELVPLYRDPRSDMPVTQFNMKWVEAAGLVKFDFLGLKTLTVLSTCLDLIEEGGGGRLDLATLPLEDRPTYDMLTRGETVGVFQLESSGMRDVLRKLRPDTLDDIIAVVALYRPGPMDNIPKYISVKHGDEPPDYLHPRLERILKETFGIMIYQEQVMQIAQELSGYTLGGADLLRRAMGKKIKAEMDAQRALFVDGAVARGVDAAKASEIFEQVNKFAGYGFNKSHAAAYALIAYQTAWLKANHPVEFLAASMTLDLANTDKLNVFRQELDRLKIGILPPDVNRSRAAFSVEKGEDGASRVRYALAGLKNVGEQAMKALVAERERGGRFRDVFDFARRMDTKAINRRQLENLVKAGALDSLEKNRGRLFNGLDTLLRIAQQAAEERDSQQVNLFGGAAEPKPNLPEAADWPIGEKLKNEHEAIGFYLSAHPMDAYARTLKRLNVLRSDEVQRNLQLGGVPRVKMAGKLDTARERTSSRGSRYAFLSFSDAGGGFEVTAFAEVLAASRALLEPGAALLLTIDARLEDDQLRLTCQQIENLDAAAARTAGGLRVVIDSEAAIPPLRDLLGREARGRGRIVLVPRWPGREVEIALKGAYALSPATIGALRTVPGVVEVAEV